MLHRIEPACEPELRNVVAFQRRVLAFACLPTLTVPLEKPEAEAHFGAQAAWFWSHTSLRPFVEAVNAAVRTNAALLARVLAAFDNDAAFDARTNDGNFRFACCALPVAARDAVRDLLRQFYTLFERGYGAEITGNGELSRAAFVAQFWEVNADLKVCPACDAGIEQAHGALHSQCDHHFPKSRHGVLSVHPRNLVPLCLECNVVFKKENDASDRARLSEMFLPYAAGREMLDHADVVVSRDAAGEYQIAFDDGGQADTARLRAVNHVVELQERWQSRVRTHVAGPIVRRLNSRRELVNRLGLGPGDVQNDLESARQGHHNARRQEHNAVLSEAFCAFLISQPAEWS